MDPEPFRPVGREQDAALVQQPRQLGMAQRRVHETDARIAPDHAPQGLKVSRRNIEVAAFDDQLGRERRRQGILEDLHAGQDVLAFVRGTPVFEREHSERPVGRLRVRKASCRDRDMMRQVEDRAIILCLEAAGDKQARGPDLGDVTRLPG